jgi:hypothetical protein
MVTWHDPQKLTAGALNELEAHVHTFEQVYQTCNRSHMVKERPWLRVDGKPLSWVLFNQGHVLRRMSSAACAICRNICAASRSAQSSPPAASTRRGQADI